jgi:hypothetical protein
MAGEEEVVLGGDGEGVAHEGGSIDDQSSGHGAGDTVERTRLKDGFTSMLTERRIERVEMLFGILLNVHFGVLLGVHHGRDGDTEVGDRAPEVCSEALSAFQLVLYILNSQLFRDVFLHPNSFRPHPLFHVILCPMNNSFAQADLGPGSAAGNLGIGSICTYELSRHSPAPCWSGS